MWECRTGSLKAEGPGARNFKSCIQKVGLVVFSSRLLVLSACTVKKPPTRTSFTSGHFPAAPHLAMVIQCRKHFLQSVRLTQSYIIKIYILCSVRKPEGVHISIPSTPGKGTQTSLAFLLKSVLCFPALTQIGVGNMMARISQTPLTTCFSIILRELETDLSGKK